MTDGLKKALEAGTHVKVTDLAPALNMSEVGLYGCIKRGAVRGIRIGGAVRVPATEAKRLLGLEAGSPT